MISDLFELLLRVVESCIIHIQLYKPEVSSETSATEYRKLKKKKNNNNNQNVRLL